MIRPLAQAALDAAGVGFSLEQVLPGARAGLVVGDGGGEFFARFSAASPGGPHPLDQYTTQVVTDVVSGVLASLGVPGAPAPPAPSSFALRFPFAGPLLPMQRLGEAAGLPPAGPLGIQIHPRFGPWWAYRAFVALAQALPALPPLASSCPACPAPCQAACPGQAVRPVSGGGFALGACVQHRLTHAPCAHDCAARRACVIAPEQAYSTAQLAFHMEASLVMVKEYQRRSGESVASDRS